MTSEHEHEHENQGLPTILWVLGLGRSGSTLLANLLARHEGVLAIAELLQLGRSIRSGGPCTCRRSVAECPFWNAVLAGMGSPVAELADALDLLQNATRSGRWRPPKPQGDVGAALTTVDALLRSFRQVTGASVIVETSKAPRFAELFTAEMGWPAVGVHLVRDPRGVAMSYQKSRDRERLRGRFESYYGRSSATRVALLWVVKNLQVGRALRRMQLPSVTVRYEDLAATPEQTSAGVLAALGLAGVGARSDEQEQIHICTGNSGVREGPRRVSLDDQWRQELRRRVLVDLITLPGRRRYGYGDFAAH